MAYTRKNIRFWEKMEQANKRSTAFYFETKSLLESKGLWNENDIEENVHTLEFTNLWNLKDIYSAEFLNDSENEGKLLGYFTLEAIRCFRGSESIRNLWYLAFGLKNFIDLYFTDLSSGIREVPNNLELADYICKKLSKNYGSYLEKIFKCLYADVGIVDESRKFYESACSPLFPYIMLLVEKEGMLSKFQEIQKRLGINIILAGKGKSSRASVEKCIFKIMERMQLPEVSKDIILLTVTDHDPDGINGVESGAIKQLEYFTSILGLNYKHLRVGLLKEDMPEDMQQPSYLGGNLFLLKPQYQSPKIQKTHYAFCKREMWELPDGNGINKFWGAEFNIMYSSNPTFFDEKIVKVLTDYLGLENIRDRARNYSYPNDWELEQAKTGLAEKLAEESYPELVNFVENLKSQLEKAQELLESKIMNPLTELMLEKINTIYSERSENLDEIDFRFRTEEREELPNTFWLDKLENIGKGNEDLTYYMHGKEFLGFKTDDLVESLKDKTKEDFDSEFEVSDFEIEDISHDLKSQINESFQESLKTTINSISGLDTLGLTIDLYEINDEDSDDSDDY